MRVSDLMLLAKKIAVGIVVTVVPLIILTGGLWLGQKIVNKTSQSGASHSVEASNAH